MSALYLMGALNEPPTGDPLQWTNNEVISWLENVFRQEGMDLRDLNFYLMMHVARCEERLTGALLSQLTYSDYIERWGYSGYVVFRCFLHCLEQAGHGISQKGNGGPTLIEIFDSLLTENADSPVSCSSPNTPSSNTSDLLSGGGKSPSIAENGHVRQMQTLPGLTSPLTPPTSDQYLSSPDQADGVFDSHFPMPYDYYPAFPQNQQTPSAFDFPRSLGSPTSSCSTDSEKPSSPKSSATSGSDMESVGHRPLIRRKKRSPLPPRPRFPPETVGPNLWEYLLELLNDKNETYKDIIQWKDKSKGCFIVTDSEVVAALWGLQRKKDGMNYDKMSRALRFYYTKGVLRKVNGLRLAYQFQEAAHWEQYQSNAIGYDYSMAGDVTLTRFGRMSRTLKKNSDSQQAHTVDHSRQQMQQCHRPGIKSSLVNKR